MGKIRVGVLMPQEVPNLALNWDPYFSAYNNGDTITTLVDTVGGKLLTAVGLPKFNTNVLNSYPVINKFVSNTVLTNSVDINTVIAGDFTLFLVVKMSAFGAQTFLLNTYIGAATGTAGAHFQVVVGSVGQLGYSEWSQHNLAVLGLNGPATTLVPLNQYCIVCLNLKRGGEAYFRTTVQNRSRVSTNVPAYINPSITDVDYGGVRAGDINIRFYGQLTLFNRALTEREETGIFRGLQLKYQI